MEIPQEQTQQTPQAQPDGAPPSPAPQPSSLRTIRTWMRDLFFSVLVSFFIILFVYQPVKVEGGSMEPGLEDQERIFINKLVYRFESIERGDIVVFRYPRDTRKSFIKRVIALPGDHIRIAYGHVYVNDEQLPEPYVPSDYLDARSYPEMVVPANAYFVLGDHRSMSNDSRDFGPVMRSYIYGKAVFGYWPMEKLGILHWVAMFKKLQVALIRRFARKRLGKDIAPLGTIASHPDVLIPYAKFSMALEKTSLVPAKLKVLGQIRAAKLVECPFWIDINSAGGRRAGITDDQIRNLNWYAESNLFSSDEKLVLELADAITATPATVTPGLRERLKQRFSTPQLVELSAAIAWENYRARSNRVFGFGSEGFYNPKG